jgi:hypothetical protein
MAPARDHAALLAKLKAKKPQTATYEVVLDVDAARSAAEARAALRTAQMLDRDVEQAEAALKAAETRLQDETVRLHLQALPRSKYEALLAEHPPTGEQKAQHETYNVDTFLPALLAATIVDPDSGAAVFDVDQVATVIAEWNQAEVAALWNTAVQVCTRVLSASPLLRTS